MLKHFIHIEQAIIQYVFSLHSCKDRILLPVYIALTVKFSMIISLIFSPFLTIPCCSRLPNLSPFSFKDFEFPRFGGDHNGNFDRSTRNHKVPTLDKVFPAKDEIEEDFNAGFYQNSRPSVQGPML